MNRALILSTSMTCALGCAFAARAQNASGHVPATQPAAAQRQSTTDTQSGIADIIVTAQKRDESIQKVPISISAVTGATLQEQRVTSVADLATVTAGLNYQAASTGVTPYIRGFGVNSGAVGNEPPATTYIDGVYLPSPSGSVFSLNNIERIEMLKGPQGTLFGRNAAAGAVSIVTRTPSHTPSLDLTAGYANYRTVSGSFYGTTGLSDNLAIDLSVAGSRQSQGWGHNLFNGSDSYLNNNISGRSKLYWTPTDRTTVTLAADYDRSRADAGLTLSTLPGTQKPPYTNAPVGGYYDTQDVVNQYRIAKQGGASLRIEQDLPWASITSISSARRLKSDGVQNATALPIPYSTFRFGLDEKTYTQEINVQSLQSSATKWIIGGYYFHDNAAYTPFAIEGTSTGQGATGQIRYYNAQRTISYAAYAQATVPFFNDRAHFTGGVRYTTDIHRLTHSYDQTLTAAGVLTPPRNVSNPTPRDSQGAFTYKATVDFAVTQKIITYISYNRGFKSGYYNITTTSGAVLPPIKAEFIDAYEIGLKSRLFGNRVVLNLSGFYYDVSDLQVRFVSPVLGFPITGNAASARNKGFDASLEVQPTTGLTLSANLTYADYRYRSYPNATFTPYVNGVQGATFVADASGKRVVFADPWSGNVAARYKAETRIGDLVANVNLSFRSTAYFDVQNSPEQRRAPYQLLSAGLSWTSPDKIWGIDIWGRNLNGAKYPIFVSYANFSGDYSPGAPRTFGATLRYHL
nr:TonB-dependent receptor [Sphingomonas sp.]